MGHRNQIGLDFHPVTRDLWATENGPQGGDEANIVLPGRNYGWPNVSLSREYPGQWVSQTPQLAGYATAEIFWWPSTAPGSN